MQNRVIHGVVFCLAIATLNAGAITRYVVPVGTPGVTPGSPYSSWATAGTNIQSVFNDANNFDTVLISNGTYALWNNTGLSMSRAVRVESFGGPVVVNGNYPASASYCLNVSHGGAVVSGLTFSNGYNNGAGGGVVMQNGTLTNCDVVNCFAVNGGGIGLPNQAAGNYYATAVNCRVFYNLSSNITANSSSVGGGISLVGSNSLVLNCTIVGNYNAKSGGAGAAGGGGVDMTAGRLVGCVISNNYCTYYGGGVRAQGPALVDGCTIASNSASVAAVGGGAYAYSGVLFTNCVVSNNYAGTGGGFGLSGGSSTVTCSTVCYNIAANNYGGMMLGAGCQVLNSTIGPSNVVATGGCGGVGIVAGSVVSNCIIVGNTANDTGGGVNMPDGLLVDSQVISNTCKAAAGGGVRMAGGRLRNSLVVGNAAPGTGAGGNPTGAGGGIYATLIGNNGGYIESCTIVSNTAYTWGGGLVVNQTNNFVTNCIIYGNTATKSGADTTDVKYQALNSGTITTETNALSYCLFTSALSPWLGHGNITNANPKFVNAAAADYRLLPSSPCRDAGINQPWMVGAKDLGGSPRVLPVDGGIVDMGAYEAPVQSGSIVNIR